MHYPIILYSIFLKERLSGRGKEHRVVGKIVSACAIPPHCYGFLSIIFKMNEKFSIA
jgi:hypothetical protein